MTEIKYISGQERRTAPGMQTLFIILVPVSGVIGALIINSLLPGWRSLSLQLHSTLEAGGAAIGLFLATIILFSRQQEFTSRRLVIACAFLSMAVFDICHSCVPAGNSFIWLHSLAGLSGGIFFSLVWLPARRISRRTILVAAVTVFLATGITGVVSTLNREIVPRMEVDNVFTPLANIINFVGGSLTILAALHFAVKYFADRDHENLFLFVLCLLFGSSGLLFPLSAAGDADWWFWHFLHLGGYLFAIGLAMLTYRRTEEILRRQSELAGFFSTATDAKRVIDRDYNQLHVNDMFTQLSGLDRESALKMKCYEVFPCPLCHTADCPVKQLKTGKTRIIQQEIVKTRSDGKKVLCILNAVSRTAPDGSYLGIMESCWDISRQKKLEKEMLNLNKKLEQKVKQRTAQLATVNQELEAFCYSVSHDLRAPLRAIQGFSKIVIEEYSSKLNKEGIRYLDNISKNISQMDKLIDDLLSFSRLGRKELSKVTIDMESIINSVIREIPDLYPGRKIVFDVKPLVPLTGDLAMVQQVIRNLISNAVKYSKDRNPAQVKIISHTANGEVIYCIEDNGVGFDMKYKDKLFGVFQRLHSSTEFEGTGIGLALVKRIVTKHGGRVWAEGQPGRGATFYFTLPG